MPNKIMITPLFDTGDDKDNEVMSFPLQEDVKIDVTSEILSWSDQAPAVDMVDKLQAVSTARGSVNEGLLDLTNMVNAPRWQKTNPLEISLTLGFYLIDNPYEDIYKPIKKLIGYAVLSRDKEGRIIPPGIFLPSVAETQMQTGDGPKKSASKLISLKIPGILFMKVAMIRNATPTFSQHITESGYPLWASLDVTITGLLPAFEDDFNADEEFGDLAEAEPKGLLGALKKIF